MTRRSNATKQVAEYFAELDRDLHGFQKTFGRIFSRKLARPHDCRKYFFEVLVSTTRLYLRFLEMQKIQKQVWGDDSTPESKPRSRKAEESVMRARFREALPALSCWSRFGPSNSFVDDNQLRTHQDYFDCVRLHLPEIYGEAIKLEGYVRSFLGTGKLSHQELADLVVGLAHTAHHVSSCHFALEILSDEMSWK